MTPRFRVLIVVAVSLAMGGCASDDGARTDQGRGERTAASATEAPSSAGAAELGAAGSGWLAGNRISVLSSAYDAEAGTVTVATTVENTATEESFEPDVTEYLLLDTGQGAPMPASSVSSVAVAGATTDIDIEFSVGVDADIDLAATVLQLGGPGYASWTVPLDGEAEGVEPREFAVSGVADAGGLLFTASRGQVLPWACEKVDDYGPGESGRIWFEPGADDEAAVVVWGDILETQSIVGGDTTATVSLTGPDGIASPQIGTVNSVFDVNEGIREFPLCFTVRTPVSGTYTLTWTSYRQAIAQLAIAIPAA